MYTVYVMCKGEVLPDTFPIPSVPLKVCWQYAKLRQKNGLQAEEKVSVSTTVIFHSNPL